MQDVPSSAELPEMADSGHCIVSDEHGYTKVLHGVRFVDQAKFVDRVSDMAGYNLQMTAYNVLHQD